MRRRCIISDGTDPDDAPERTKKFFEIAEIAVGGKLIHPATGTLGPNGMVHDRPPIGGAGRNRAKRQVTLRLDPDVVDAFCEGWQGRINAALRKAAGL